MLFKRQYCSFKIALVKPYPVLKTLFRNETFGAYQRYKYCNYVVFPEVSDRHNATRKLQPSTFSSTLNQLAFV